MMKIYIILLHQNQNKSNKLVLEHVKDKNINTLLLQNKMMKIVFYLLYQNKYKSNSLRAC